MIRSARPSVRHRVAQAYHDYGRVCSAHPVACLCISLLTMMVLSYPAVTRFRLPVSSPFDVHWTDGSPKPFGEGVPEWLNSKPAVYVQQIVVRASVEPWISKKLTSEQSIRGPLSRSFRIREELLDDVMVDEHCMHIARSNPGVLLPNMGCLLLSAAAFWNNDLQRFTSDSNVLDTVFGPDCTPAWCPRDMLLGLPTGMTGIKPKFQTNRKRNIDFSTTLFFAEFNESLNKILVERLVNTNEFVQLKSKASDDTTFVHVFYRSRKYVADYFPIASTIAIFMLYVYYSSRKFVMVASRWGLALASAACIVATLLMTTGICAHLELTPTLWSAEVFPYIALILGLENILSITGAVVSTSPSLDVSSRVAHGLSQEGYTLCKYFSLEMMCLAIGYSTQISEIQEFCTLGAIALIIDFYMQLLFFTPCLTFDLLRLNEADKRRFALMLFSTEIPQLKMYPATSCPMRFWWPGIFEEKRRVKRTFSDSQMEDREGALVNNGSKRGLKRSMSTRRHLTENENWSVLGEDVLSLRIRFLYYITKNRIVQRSIMAIFALWVVYLGLIVHRHPSDSPIGFGVSHRILETAPLEWGDWQRRTFKWWPVLFAEYNMSLTGRYLTFLPPIVLSAQISPNDPMLEIIKDARSEEKLDLQVDKQTGPDAPSDITSRIYWLETQLKMSLFLFWLLVLCSVIGFFLYACFWGRWRTNSHYTKLDTTSPSSLNESPITIETMGVSLSGHRFPIECVVVGGDCLLSVCQEGRLCKWNVQSGELVGRVMRLRAAPSETAPAPLSPSIWTIDADSRIAVLGCGDGSIEVASLERNKLIGVYHQSPIGVVHVALFGQRIIVVRIDGTIEFIDIEFTTEPPLKLTSLTLAGNVRAHLKPISQLLAVSPLCAVTASHDHTVKVWNVRDHRLDTTLVGHNAPVVSVAVHSMSNTLFSACELGTICCWSLDVGSLLRTLHIDSSCSVNVGCCGSVIVAATSQNQVVVWDRVSGAVITRMSPMHRSTKDERLVVHDVVVLNEQLCVTSSRERILVWDVRKKTLIKEIEVGARVNRLVELKGGQLLVICSNTMHRIAGSSLFSESSTSSIGESAKKN